MASIGEDVRYQLIVDNREFGLPQISLDNLYKLSEIEGLGAYDDHGVFSFFGDNDVEIEVYYKPVIPCEMVHINISNDYDKTS